MGLIDRLFHSHRVPDMPGLQAAVERAVDLVEPRLKLAGGYPDRYREPVAHALAYCQTLAAQVPGPIAVNREAYARDPLVHALFPSVDEIRAAMCVSQAMRDFRKTYPYATDVYALMGMRRRESKVFGMEMQGETLKRDVPQEVVYFADHTLADPAPSEVEARERIAIGFFDSLMAHVAERMMARRGERAELEIEKAKLLDDLHGASAEARPALENQLRELLSRSQSLQQLLDLRQYGEDFMAVLMAPERYLYLERTAISLDGMGVRRAGQDGEEIQFCDLIGRDRRRWTVTMVHCGNVLGEVTLSERLATGQRWLGL